MAITSEQVKDFEANYKKVLFGEINSLTLAQSKLITLIQDNQKLIGTTEDLPNIAITLHNKIIELSHQFEESGLSMFSSKTEDYGAFKLDFLGASIVGKATIFDMISKVDQGTEILRKYDLEFSRISKPKNQLIKSLENSGRIKKFLFKLSCIINPRKLMNFSYSEEEKQNLSSYLSEYSSIDEELWNYNLRDNIIPSLVNHLKGESYSKENAFEILEECIISDLQKLGLGDLIPQLKEELNKAYDENSLHSWTLSPAEQLEMQQAQHQIAQKYNSTLSEPNPNNFSIQEEQK